MSVRPYSFTSVTISVPDVAASSLFFQFHVGLEEVSAEAGHRFLRCGLEHHSVHLSEDSDLERAQVTSIAYSVKSRSDLQALAARLDEAGCPVETASPERSRFAVEALRTVDPNGLSVEFVYQPFVFAEPPISAFGPLEMVHPFIWTDRYVESVEFYESLVGFRPSDYIEHKLVFLRCGDRFHHSLALLEAETFGIAHLCFLMPSIEAVMRGRARAQFREVSLPVDLVKHSASQSIAVYLHDERHGPWIELCDSHLRFTSDEDETHEPRFMVDDPRNVMDVWRASADHDWRSLH